MTFIPGEKYKAFEPINLPDRQWPTKVIDKAPIWCSVDLRDGNQALIEPMGHERKLRMFRHLVELGFKEIEVGFPSASQTDFDFVRFLIEEGEIPDDVKIQVLTQAREELIRKTYDSIRGAKQAIVHLYNSTSTLQRRVVFDMDRAGIKEIATDGAKLVRQLADEMPETHIQMEYSPESFTQTELDYACEVCTAVMEIWKPTVDNKIIFNLPATVEVASANIYADQIEWMHRNLPEREKIILSLHPHNDRGTGVAAAEFGIMAGADRVEGTLFGNGERTGNVDVVNIAMNLYTQGVDPKLDFSDINEVVRTVEYCNQLPVHPRHPYGGDLVFTAFSGSHQDAIKKGFAAIRQANSELWEIPYLPIDPADLGRNYDAVIRVNSQSGKGGVAYLLEEDYGIELPRLLQVELSKIVQAVTDETGKELSSATIYDIFEKEYLNANGGLEFVNHQTTSESPTSERRKLIATIRDGGQEKTLEGVGTGPIDAYMSALTKSYNIDLKVNDYREHTTGFGSDAVAIAYVEMRDAKGEPIFGVGRHANIVTASLKAITSAVNRSKKQ
ncbi:2-isopropylmalate synthase [uncultured Sneathiella sp.]|jgi:2-isopropylmalate synthase|uniref:2-isopropylmalate synthase n=1 Tax=uncultured Sneathiella sp. TaxID=879315 RepID=UPI0030DB3569|tara:strand:- start:908 stop:2581 length:1674 start_codon:yes stop_codon:yes gene_type:complete